MLTFSLYLLLFAFFLAMSIYAWRLRFTQPALYGGPLQEGHITWPLMVLVMILLGVWWLASAQSIGFDEQGLYFVRNSRTDCLGPGCKFLAEQLTKVRPHLW